MLFHVKKRVKNVTEIVQKLSRNADLTAKRGESENAMFVEYRKGYDIFRHKDGNGKTYYAITEHMRKGVLLTFRTLEEARNFIDDLTA